MMERLACESSTTASEMLRGGGLSREGADTAACSSRRRAASSRARSPAVRFAAATATTKSFGPAASPRASRSPAPERSSRLAGVAIMSAARLTLGSFSISAATRINSTESRYVSGRTRQQVVLATMLPPFVQSPPHRAGSGAAVRQALLRANDGDDRRDDCPRARAMWLLRSSQMATAGGATPMAYTLLLLFREPDRVELVVEEVAGRGGPPALELTGLTSIDWNLNRERSSSEILVAMKVGGLLSLGAPPENKHQAT